MKAFSEKSDLVLRTLSSSPHLNWAKFTQLTEINHSDAILIFLKNRHLIEYSDNFVMLTNKGREFINSTSFVEQRDDQQQV